MKCVGVMCEILSGAKDLVDSTFHITHREILHCVQNDLFVAGILLCTREAEEFVMVWGWSV